MTELEIRCALALDPENIFYFPNSSAKRFAQNMAFAAKSAPKRQLSAEQSKFLLNLTVNRAASVEDAQLVADAKEVLAE